MGFSSGRANSGRLGAPWMTGHAPDSPEKGGGVSLQASEAARAEVQGQERTHDEPKMSMGGGGGGGGMGRGRGQGRNVLVSPPWGAGLLLRVTGSHQMVDRGCWKDCRP